MELTVRFPIPIWEQLIFPRKDSIQRWAPDRERDEQGSAWDDCPSL